MADTTSSNSTFVLSNTSVRGSRRPSFGMPLERLYSSGILETKSLQVIKATSGSTAAPCAAPITNAVI